MKKEVTKRARRQKILFQKLMTEPQVFSFFQAVRILVAYWHEHGLIRKPLLERQGICFKSHVTLRFPTAEIQSISQTDLKHSIEVIVNFLGIAGTTGLLPAHYTSTLLRRIHHKDTVLRDFLDIFHHRSTWFFYHAWEKYRFYAGYERTRLQKRDPFSKMLDSLVGLSSDNLTKSARVSEDILRFYAGHFAKRNRTAVALQQLLSGYFGAPVEVIQFRGAWLPITLVDRTQLGYRNNVLGADMVIGERVWSCQHKIRLKAGPLSAELVNMFLPDVRLAFRHLCQLARLFIDVNLAFDVQLVFESKAIVPWTLQKEPTAILGLGWNVWLPNKAFPKEVSDVIVEERRL